MALSGSITTGACEGRSLTLKWSAAQDTANNTSTISWNVVGSGGTSPSWVYIHELRVTINGEVVKYIEDVNKKCYVGTEIVSTTKTSIKHNNDGTKSFSIKLEAGIWYYKISKSAGKTFTLNAIPRAASISSAQNITLGNKCSIKWQPKLNTHKYKLKFSLSNWNHTTDFISPNTTSAYTYTGYTLPLEVANQLPSSTTGKMNVSLYTYDSSGKQIGSASNSTFTVTVPDDIKPTISNVEATIKNGGLVGSLDSYFSSDTPICNISKVNISANATGSYGSTIQSYIITGYYKETIVGKTLDYTGETITSSGNQNFEVVAKDSRGRLSNKIIKTFNFTYWKEPSFISYSAKRTDDDETKIEIKAKVSGVIIKDNEERTNLISVFIYYKEEKSENYTSYGSYLGGWGRVNSTIGSFCEESTMILDDFSPDKTYYIKLQLRDYISQSGDGVQVDCYIPPASATMDFRAGGKGIGIGRVAEADGLEIGFETTFFNKVYLKNIDTSQKKTSLKDYVKSLIDEDYIKSIIDKDYVKSLTS